MTEDCNALIRFNSIHDNSAVLTVDLDDWPLLCQECPGLYGCEDECMYMDVNRWLSARGGGIASTGSGGLEILGNRIVNNTVSGAVLGAGGGISMRVQPTEGITIRNNLIAGNHGGDEGGGVHVEYWPWCWLAYPEEITDASIDVLNNVIRGNDAEVGAGHFVQDETQVGRFANNIVTCNAAAAAGGGISAPADSIVTPARYAYNDVYGNTAPSGTNWGGPFDPGGQAAYGNIALEPAFFGLIGCRVDYDDICDYRLSNLSPCHHVGDPRIEDNNCDGTRNDMGIFGGSGLCEEMPCDLPWVINLSSGTAPNCVINFTWNTARAATCQFGYKIGANGIYTWLLPTTGTTHQQSFVFQDNAPYYYKIISTMSGGSGLQTVLERNFRYHCYSQGGGVSNLGLNPYRPGSEISFESAEPALTEIEIYDVQGRRVTTLLSQMMEPGSHAVRWDGRSSSGENLPSGIYFLHYRSGDRTEIKQIALLK